MNLNANPCIPAESPQDIIPYSKAEQGKGKKVGEKKKTIFDNSDGCTRKAKNSGKEAPCSEKEKKKAVIKLSRK